MAVAVMPMMAMMPVVAVVPVMVTAMMMEAHLGGLHLGTLLNRRGGAGIGQRQRLGLFGRSGQHQQSADRSQSQKSQYVHFILLWESSCSHACRVVDRIKPRAAALIAR
jgi:hypothetical protein